MIESESENETDSMAASPSSSPPRVPPPRIDVDDPSLFEFGGTSNLEGIQQINGQMVT